MIFTLSYNKKLYCIFLAGIVFFASISVLCPIKNYVFADTPSVNKKMTEDQIKDAEAKKNEPGAGDTLYNYERPTAEEDSYGWMIFKTIIVLGLLVGGFYYFYRFVTKKAGIQLVGREVIKILSIVPVGQNKYLQVVDLAGRLMVIGVSDSGITLITEIKDKDEIDRIRLLSSKSTPVQPGGFQEYISRYISKLLGNKNHSGKRGNFEAKYEDVPIDRMDYLKKQRERLKKINGNDNEI